MALTIFKNFVDFTDLLITRLRCWDSFIRESRDKIDIISAPFLMECLVPSRSRYQSTILAEMAQ